MLLVDGHNSHYTLPFLLHARRHEIIVLCYPAHGTHIYQGLDVVVFAVLKRYLSDERDKEFREHGRVINKTNFLAIYSRAHVRALTKENILSAFRKTGVHPFNPNIVTEDMLAPAKTTSIEGHLPLPPPTPIKAIARLLEKLSINDQQFDAISEGESDAPEDDFGGAPTAPQNPPMNPTHKLVEETVDKLSQTDLGYLLSGTHSITSTDPMHTSRPHPIPSLAAPVDLLSIIPKTETEVMLLAALREAHEANEVLKKRIINLQASNVLNEIYCNKLQFQLAYKEEKKAKEDMKGRLAGDGLPKMLTGDEFYERVVEFTKWQKDQEREKEERREETLGYKEEVEMWKKLEDERKAKNKALSEKYHTAVAAWQKRREAAKAKGKLSLFKDLKPKMGPKFKAIPKPKKRRQAAKVLEDGGEDEGEAFDNVSSGEDEEDEDAED